MKVYIAGPMQGIPELNFPAFDEVRDRLIAAGHVPVSPADLDREVGIDPKEGTVGFTDQMWKDIIKRDLDALQECDAIVMLEGWHRSTGARAELAVAHWMKIPRLDRTHFQVMER